MRLIASMIVALCLASHAPADPPAYQWSQNPVDQSSWFCWRGRVQVGHWNAETEVYRTYNATARTWGPRARPPIIPPVRPDLNFGIVEAEVHNTTAPEEGPRYRVNGRFVSRSEAQAAVTAGTLQDDSALNRLTLIGSVDDRRRVLSDLDSDPGLQALRARILVQAYDATDPMISGLGFVTTGTPSIYLQAPTGRVLHRTETYTGPQDLATAIRRADPSYNSASDPNLNKPAIPIDLSKVPPWAWVAGAAGIGLALTKRSV